MAGNVRAAVCTFVQSFFKYPRSALSSSSLASSACVRTINPPFSSVGTSACTRPRSAWRSASEPIFCEMPICGSWGKYTNMRPAILICVDSRAPLLPSGSLMTCVIRLCPSKSSFSIAMGGVFWVRACRFSRKSAMCKNAAFSRPISINALCMPGKTRTTLPK